MTPKNDDVSLKIVDQMATDIADGFDVTRTLVKNDVINHVLIYECHLIDEHKFGYGRWTA